MYRRRSENLKFTLPDLELVVKVIWLLFLLLEYVLSNLDIFVLEAHVLCVKQ
jgi:hypothetical protein